MIDKAHAGKVACVTGAGRGIGFNIARLLAREGAKVAVADISPDLGKAAVAAIEAEGGDAFFVQTDLAAPGATHRLIDDVVAHYGAIGILVNNAKAGKRLGFGDETEGNWDLACDVGLKAAFFATQRAVHHMATGGGGAIVNISSVAGIVAGMDAPGYHAAKGGLIAVTRYCAVAAAAAKVRVNAVLPGMIVQDEHVARYREKNNAGYRSIVEAAQPGGTIGGSDDVAQAVSFLCGDQARFVNGHCLVIDGGLTVQDPLAMLFRHGLPR